MDKTVSKTISFLRFPLACLVVWSHYYIQAISSEVILSKSAGVYALIGQFSKTIHVIAVPLFFFISGYLYFADVRDSHFRFDSYKHKTLNRIKSLVVPFLSWNLLLLCFYATLQALRGSQDVMQQESLKMIADYQAADYLRAVFGINGDPIDTPLWFIRDLIVTSIVLPYPIWYLMRKTGIWGMAVLWTVWQLTGSMPLPSACIFYFSWGTLCAIKGSDLFTGVSGNTSRQFGAVIITFMIIYFTSKLSDSASVEMFKHIYIFAAIALIFGWLAPYIRKERTKPIRLLETGSFFIFAMHLPVMSLLRKYTFSLLQPESELMLSILVMVTPATTIAICLTTFYVIKRYLPFLRFLNGFRL